MWQTIITWITSNWAEFTGILILIYTFLARFIPTLNDWDLINKLIKIINIIFPNLGRNGTRHVMESRLKRKDE
ncbi:MAG: hypothetical protein PHS33_07970 [Candidatus Omnitrophica bacterium]|nr:hypothetical protein [Candidatus Omnitrophota bacterium]